MGSMFQIRDHSTVHLSSRANRSLASRASRYICASTCASRSAQAATLSAASRLAVYGAMAVAVPALRRRKDGKAQFLIPAPYFFAGFALVASLIPLTQMGRGEFYVVGTTCGIALLNWILVRR